MHYCKLNNTNHEINHDYTFISVENNNTDNIYFIFNIDISYYSKMKMFIIYNRERILMDVGSYETIGTIKKKIMKRVAISSNLKSSFDNQKYKFELLYKGKIIEDDSLFTKLFLYPMCTLNCHFIAKPEYNIKVIVRCLKKSISMYIDLENENVSTLSTKLENLLGLSVGLFYLIHQPSNRRLYNKNNFKYYEIKVADIIIVETIKLPKNFLKSLKKGDVVSTFNSIPKFKDNAYLNLYLWRNVLFTAAHFNLKEMANIAIQEGVRYVVFNRATFYCYDKA